MDAWAQAPYVGWYFCLHRECFDSRISSPRPDNRAPSTAPKDARVQDLVPVVGLSVLVLPFGFARSKHVCRLSLRLNI